MLSKHLSPIFKSMKKYFHIFVIINIIITLIQNQENLYKKIYITKEKYKFHISKNAQSIIHTVLFNKKSKSFKKAKLAVIFSIGKIRSLFNDPDINRQWYINRGNYKNYISHDLNEIWNNGITGEGITIGIIGGGVESEHRDLFINYNERLSYNFDNNSFKIIVSKHGDSTIAAGLISAAPNNAECGVGAAPSSKFSNLQIYVNRKEPLKPLIIGKAFSYEFQKIHIHLLLYNLNMHNNIRNFLTVIVPENLRDNFIYGRNGLGNLLVMGAGDNGNRGNNCAFNGIAQLPEMLVFGAINHNGSSPIFTESCNAILAASLSSDYDSGKSELYSTYSGNKCGNSAYGSLGSASISAGILALLISANPSLNIRQIVFLIILSSLQYDPYSIKNALGYSYSYSFGWGMLNVKGLIELSQIDEITSISSENICKTRTFKPNTLLHKMKMTNISIYTSGCVGSDSCVTDIEQTFIVISIRTYSRKTVKIFLTSPSGTRFLILVPRFFDTSKNGFRSWRIKLLGYFGENPFGVWILEILTGRHSARLQKIEVIFHGTCLKSSKNIISQLNLYHYIYSNYINFTTIVFPTIWHPPILDLQKRLFLDDFSFTNNEFPDIQSISSLF